MRFLEDIALCARLRPRLVHRLPGRLRFRIPALADVPEGWQEFAAIVERILAVPEGIRRVRADYRTGSLLVEYDPEAPEALEADQVQRFLGGVLDMVRRHRARVAGMSRDQALEAAARLEVWMAEQDGFQGVIDSMVEIPNEIWT